MDEQKSLDSHNSKMQVPASDPLPRLNDKSSKSKHKSTEPQTEPVERKAKTFNRLDHRFQLTSEHDDEHIFPEEYEMIKQLREKYPTLKEFSDKKIVCFLCARRHKMSDVEILIERHLKKRQELGIDKEHPATYQDAWKVMKQGCIIYWKDVIDKHERIVEYYKIGKDDPKSTTLEEKLRMLYWECDYFCKMRPLKHIRNGLIVIVDMKEFKFANLDFANGKQINEAMTGLFPRRIRKFVVVNGGFMVRGAIATAKLIMPKKLMKRVDIVSDLSVDIDIPHLLVEYGGNLTITLDDLYQNVLLKSDEMDG